VPSPTVIVPAAISEDLLQIAAAICARYAKTPADEPAKVEILQGSESRIINVMPMKPEDVEQFRVTL